jgi:hypothetical protein
MKDILENKKIFEAHAQIDYCYFLIKEINANMSNEYTSPIDLAIDKATGNNPLNNKIKDLILLLKIIIECKKEIEADYSNDEKMLNTLTKLK